MTIQDAPTGPSQDVELIIGGMTCASCAARIERKLNKLDGVTATVNYATEKAKVSHPATVTREDLIKVVVDTGYAATLPSRRNPPMTAAPRRLKTSTTNTPGHCASACSFRSRWAFR